MSNTNCLRGYGCPRCGSHGPFEALTVGWVEWTDDGTEGVITNPEFQEGGQMRCLECEHSAPNQEFKLPEEPLVGSIETIEILVRHGEHDVFLDLLSNLRDDHEDVVVEWQYGDQATEECTLSQAHERFNLTAYQRQLLAGAKPEKDV